MVEDKFFFFSLTKDFFVCFYGRKYVCYTPHQRRVIQKNANATDWAHRVTLSCMVTWKGAGEGKAPPPPRVRIISCWTRTHGDIKSNYLIFLLYLFWVVGLSRGGDLARAPNFGTWYIIFRFSLDSHRQRRLLNAPWPRGDLTSHFDHEERWRVVTFNVFALFL